MPCVRNLGQQRGCRSGSFDQGFRIERCLVSGNESFGDGGSAIHSDNAAEILFENCTVVENTALCGQATDGIIVFGGERSATCTVRNSIFWGNSPGGFVELPYPSGSVPSVNVSYSNTQNVLMAGTGNISADPEFLHPGEHDYNLGIESPCFNTGDPESPEDEDGTRCDMGAFPRFHDPVSARIPISFNPVVWVQYSLAERLDVRFQIHNSLGQQVRAFRLGEQPPGYHTLMWDGRDGNGRQLGSSVYVIRMVAGTQTAVTRVTMVK